ncbi:MAG TPA: hypothetical protein VK821_08340 [Dehalococcoidia bacterium]|nr:hypothetical protein [Dehalococcoidia bacterium]
MRKVKWVSLLFVIGSMACAVAAVGTGYSLFGQASYVSPGHNSNRAVQLIADGNAQIFSGIDYSIPAGLTINNLNMLSTDYDFTAASCGVGSPRFGVQLAGFSGTIFVYIGPPPSYAGCPPNVWTNTSNLLTPTSFVDTSQLPGGTFYDPWSVAQARYSGKTVTDIFLVSDYGPSGSQTVLIDNTNVNGTLYDYEFASKDDCKDGGWHNFTFPPGPFKNQGQCVSYFAQQK